MLRSNDEGPEGVGEKRRRGGGLMLVSVCLLLAVASVGVATWFTPVPINLGPIALVGPNCKDTAVFSVTPVPAGPGVGPSTLINSHLTNIPMGSQLTFAGDGMGAVLATRTGGVGVTTVVGRHVFEAFGLALVVRF
jgi:hypothetical protein